MDYKKIFIENLKHYRGLKRISQAKLAELCNVQPGTIGSIEIGRQFPSFDLLFKMSEALSIHPADLLLRDASKMPEVLEIAEKLNSLPEKQKNAIKNMISEMCIEYSSNKHH